MATRKRSSNITRRMCSNIIKKYSNQKNAYLSQIIMTINNLCFISYPHGSTQSNLTGQQKDLISDFLSQFIEALRFYIPSYVKKVNRDVVVDSEYLKPGSSPDEALGQAICESACMIVVFVPAFNESLYCKREFLAMEKVERRRRSLLGSDFDNKNRMIIPIILRGSDELPAKIKNITYSQDFSRFQSTGRTIKKIKEYQPKIEELVKYIRNHYKNLKYQEVNGKNLNCIYFKLPSDQKATGMWSKITPMKYPPFPSEAFL